MKAEIISIGDELLLGQVVNSNSSWLGLTLADLGIEISRVVMVGDDESVISGAVGESFERVSLVILTGGLGPTRDDKTKEVLCSFFKTKLVMHQPALDSIRELFASRNYPVTRLNEMQAELPESCIPLRNPVGTAWGMWLEQDGKICISLPGVPYEMKEIVMGEVIPALLKRFSGLVPKTYRTLLTAGLPESVLAERIALWEENLPGEISLAYLPQPGMVRLRLSTQTREGKDSLDKRFEELKDLLKEAAWGEGDEELAGVAGKLLREKNLRLAMAESCTGGYISHLITSLPGSSEYFEGGVVSYSNQLKMELLSVNSGTLQQHGAVSRETAVEMVQGIMDRTGAQAGIAVTGVAGPGGGTEEKPVGTVWIAVKIKDELEVRKYSFGEHRGRNIQRSAVMALFTLIRMLRS